MRKPSAAQKERQKKEFRDKGKYAKVNPCQCCGKSAGVDYFSHPLTDSKGWGCNALVLCEKCAGATQEFQNYSEFIAYRKKLKKRKIKKV